MIEIERKFLISPSELPDLWEFDSRELIQGYLSSSERNTIRIRISNKEAFLTIKSKTVGLTRSEFEYSVPYEDAKEMLKLCGDKLVEKTRYFIPNEGHTWELDVFKGKLEGLILAEVELKAEDEKVGLPQWLGKEVSLDSRYFNSNLSALSFEDAQDLISAQVAL